MPNCCCVLFRHHWACLVLFFEHAIALPCFYYIGLNIIFTTNVSSIEEHRKLIEKHRYRKTDIKQYINILLYVQIN